MTRTGQPVEQDGRRTEGQAGAGAEPGREADRGQTEQEQLPGAGEEVADRRSRDKHRKFHR